MGSITKWKRMKMARSASAATGQSKPNPRGIQVKVPPPRQYLCSHICRCASGSKLLDKAGRILRQRCVTTGIRNDYDNKVQNVYIGEVGYDMTKRPPAPLMSRNEVGRPSRFPLGAATTAGILNVDKDELEATGGSAFRIPDVVKLKMPNIPPIQSNIELVIEIKFDGDRWRPGQEEAYQEIAGSRSKLLLINETDCHCETKPPEQSINKEKQNTATYQTAIIEKYYPSTTEDPKLQYNLSDFLINGAKTIGGVVFIAGIIYLSPIIGSALIGALVISRAANAKE